MTLGWRNVQYHCGNVGQPVGRCAGLVSENCRPKVGHVLTDMYPGYIADTLLNFFNLISLFQSTAVLMTLLMLSWRTVDRSVDQYASDKKTPPDQDIGLYSADIRMNLDRVLAHVVVSINWQSTEMQRAKKVVSDSPRLVDFVVGLVNSVLNLPNRQVKYFEESTYRKTVKSKFFCSSKNLGG